MIKKSFTAICIILLLVISILSIMQVEVVDANPYSPPKPAIPEFTLKYVDNSYNVAGNFVQNKSIEVTTEVLRF